MIELSQLEAKYDPADWFRVGKALEVLVETGFFTRLSQQNTNHLVENRLDYENLDSIVEEVRVARQTNRVLLQLQESARQLIKENDDEN